MQLGILGPGDFFGEELFLFDEKNRRNCAIAASHKVTLLALDPEVIDFF